MLLRHSPTIDELLGDSLVQAVMLADNVEQQALRTVLTDAATRIAAARPEREPGLAKGIFANPGIRGPIGPVRVRPQSPSEACRPGLCC